MDDLENLLTPEQVAEKLSLAKSTVYNFANRGVLPAVKMGKSIRFRPEALKAALKKLESKGYGAAA